MDPHATDIRKDQRKGLKTQLTQTKKLIGLDWRTHYNDQSYDLNSSTKQAELKNP